MEAENPIKTKKFVANAASETDFFQSRHMLVTLQRIRCLDAGKWLEKAKAFHKSCDAFLVAIESNKKEFKGDHIHIALQFSPRQKLTRNRFIKHFVEYDGQSLNIKTKPNKASLIAMLQYCSKLGKALVWGSFTYRGLIMKSNISDLQFQYLVRDGDSALSFYYKMIHESDNEQFFVENLADSDTAIGRYLAQRSVLKNHLVRYETKYRNRICEERKQGVEVAAFAKVYETLRSEYIEYLKIYPKIFKEHRGLNDQTPLEADYDKHIDKEVRTLHMIISKILESEKYHWNRPMKSMNIHLWSHKPNFGKSYFINFLSKYAKSYRLPDFRWYGSYMNSVYQFVISDEAENFIKSKDLSHLKQLFEGSYVELQRKHKVSVFKNDNPLIITADNRGFFKILKEVLYNQSPYDREVIKEIMAARICSMYLYSRATLFFLTDHCLKVKLPSS